MLLMKYLARSTRFVEPPIPRVTTLSFGPQPPSGAAHAYGCCSTAPNEKTFGEVASSGSWAAWATRSASSTLGFTTAVVVEGEASSWEHAPPATSAVATPRPIVHD